MVDQSRRHYHIPADKVGDQDYFSYYLWITQIQQGRCMATISEKQRRSRSNSTVNNMGVIYWQFNTDWQSPSWSTLDYSGNWKVSHNMIKSTFAPLLVTSYFTNGTFDVWVVNDGLSQINDA